MPDQNDKLTRLIIKRDALNEQIKQEQARGNAVKRKQDTRRKILAGAAVLDEAEKDGVFKTQLYKLLNRFLTKPEDRKLFDMAVASSPSGNSQNTKADTKEPPPEINS